MRVLIPIISLCFLSGLLSAWFPCFQSDIDNGTGKYELTEESAVGYCERGILKLDRCEFEDAIEDFDRSLRLNPRHARAYNNRGIARERLSDYQGAMGDFTQAIELKYMMASYNRARLRDTLLDRKGAIEDLTECISHKFLLLQSYACRGWERECMGDKAGAVSDFKTALTFAPTDALEFGNIGWILANSGKHREALIYFEKSIALDSNSSSSFDKRAKSKRALGDLSGALKDLKQASKLDFGHVDDSIDVGRVEPYAYRRSENLLFDKGDCESALHTAALTSMSAGIKSNPKNAILWAYRAVSKRKLGDDKGAIEDLNYAISLDKKYGWAYLCRGISKENLHDLKGAMTDYNLSVRIRQSNIYGFIKRGHLKATLADWKSSLRDYYYAIKMSSNAIPCIAKDVFTVRR